MRAFFLATAYAAQGEPVQASAVGRQALDLTVRLTSARSEVISGLLTDRGGIGSLPRIQADALQAGTGAMAAILTAPPNGARSKTAFPPGWSRSPPTCSAMRSSSPSPRRTTRPSSRGEAHDSTPGRSAR